MKIGYMRVSTDMQKHDMQKDALTAAGCDKIYMDTISGKTRKRPGFDQMLSEAVSGDTIVVWKIDRMGRSLQHLLEVLMDIKARGIGFKSLSESLDTATATGNLMFQLIGAFAEFERNMICERVKAGVAAKRARQDGVWGKRATIDAAAVRALGVRRAMSELGVSRTSAYRICHGA